MATKLINGVYHTSIHELGGGATESVLYIEQDLTTEQKAQARTNIGAGTGTYTKAAAGIPKADLESAVQASLDLANTAIQARPSGEVDPTITPAEYATQEELSQLDQKVFGGETLVVSSVSGWKNYFSFTAKAGFRYTFKLSCSPAVDSTKYVGLGSDVEKRDYISKELKTGKSSIEFQYEPQEDTTVFFNSYGAMTNVVAKYEESGDNITSLANRVNRLYSTDNETILSRDLYQGTLYLGVPESNAKCVYCAKFLPVYSGIIVLHNKKDSDNSYWKVRVCAYDKEKNYLTTPYGYNFTNGDAEIDVSNAAYIRIAVSRYSSSDTNTNCAPSDFPDGLISLSLGEKPRTEQAENINVFSLSTLRKMTRILDVSMEAVWTVDYKYGGAACYGNRVFQFVDGNANVYVYNAENGNLVDTVMMPNPSVQYHNNCVSFGWEKYDPNDYFPIIYASQEHSSQNTILAYRITENNNVFSLELIQTITMPTNSSTWLYYHNAIINAAKKQIVLLGLLNNPYSANDNNIVNYIVFGLPEISEGNVSLSMGDALMRSAYFERMATPQSGFIKNGLLYQVFGVSAPQYLMVMNVDLMEFVASFNITEEYGNLEPQSVYTYNNALYIVFNNGNVVKIEH